MIFNIKYTEKDEDGNTLNEYFWEIDDLVLFDNQPDEFKGLFNSISVDNIAGFDNATVILFPESNRVIISKK